ncbi:MAG: hypothetical protein IKR19_08380 [Acholeplasmatales bacterium]|nr:hypothetical protein [Acholeplasmatales bacterium]
MLLDSLAKEPTMVLSTAYAYAKNYVEYGEDITKAWTTAVQQTTILEQVKTKAYTEAYDSFKKDYENRLKADILTKLQTEIEELPMYYDPLDISDLIQQKINALKENTDDVRRNRKI